MKKKVIIWANLAVSLTLASTGMAGMVLRDPWFGAGYEWSTALWIVGMITLWLIPLEVCVIKSPKRDSLPGSGK